SARVLNTSIWKCVSVEGRSVMRESRANTYAHVPIESRTRSRVVLKPAPVGELLHAGRRWQRWHVLIHHQGIQSAGLALAPASNFFAALVRLQDLHIRISDTRWKRHNTGYRGERLSPRYWLASAAGGGGRTAATVRQNKLSM